MNNNCTSVVGSIEMENKNENSVTDRSHRFFTQWEITRFFICFEEDNFLYFESADGILNTTDFSPKRSEVRLPSHLQPVNDPGVELGWVAGTLNGLWLGNSSVLSGIVAPGAIFRLREL